MALKSVYVCDVCGIEPKDGDLSPWRKVTVGPLIAPTPETPSLVNPLAPETAPSLQEAMVCHKPSCLTKLAKDWNENKVEPEPVP